MNMRTIIRIGSGAALTMGVLLALVASARAHISYDGNGNFKHQSHSRDLNFISSVDDSVWAPETRNAQLNWHSTMNGSLRYYTTSHDAAVIHAVDDNYGQTGWSGYAYNWGHHNGHGHAQLNLFYGAGYNSSQKRSVACHEIGHFTGLAHTTDASDCMTSALAWPTHIDSGHRDQVRSAWNSTGH